MTIDIPGLRALWKQAFRDSDAFLDGFFSTGFSPSRCRFLTEDDRTVAALYWFDCLWQQKKLAYIYAVATDKAFRGRGFCRRLMEDTHHHLAALGYAGAVLVPGEPGLFSLYEKLGYQAFCPMQTLSIQPEGQTALREISPAAYETARKDHLPENSVIQGGDSLAFYATYGNFYQGDGCLFAAAREGDTLYFQEYFGEISLAPGVLTALHTQKGVLPIPGGNAPFAMYLPLNGTDTLPAYFGIPLN